MVAIWGSPGGNVFRWQRFDSNEEAEAWIERMWDSSEKAPPDHQAYRQARIITEEVAVQFRWPNGVPMYPQTIREERIEQTQHGPRQVFSHDLVSRFPAVEPLLLTPEQGRKIHEDLIRRTSHLHKIPVGPNTTSPSFEPFQAFKTFQILNTWLQLHAPQTVSHWHSRYEHFTNLGAEQSETLIETFFTEGITHEFITELMANYKKAKNRADYLVMAALCAFCMKQYELTRLLIDAIDPAR